MAPASIMRWARPNTLALDEQAVDTTFDGPASPRYSRRNAATENVLCEPR